MPFVAYPIPYCYRVEQAFMPAFSLNYSIRALAPEVPITCNDVRSRRLPGAHIRLAQSPNPIHLPDLPGFFHPL